MVRSMVKRKTDEDTRSWKDKIYENIDKYNFTLETERDYFRHKLTNRKGKAYRKAAETNKTKVLEQSIKDSVIKQSNLIFLVNGSPRSGKSKFAQSLMYLIRKEFRLLEFFYPISVEFTREDIKRVLTTVTPPFGLIEDELPNESGKDSQLKYEAVKNVSESVRKAQISIGLCTPIKEGGNFTNFRFLMFGTNEKESMLRAFIFELDQKEPSGYVEIPYHQDKEFEEEYEIKKDMFIRNMRETGGLVISDFSKEKAEKDVQFYYNKIKAQFGTRVTSDKKLIKLMELDGYIETENFKERVAAKISALLLVDGLREKEERRREAKLPKIMPGTVSQVPFMQWEDLNRRELIYKILESKVSELDVEVYAAICAKEGFRSIAKRFFGSAKNTKKVHKIKENIQQNFLGEAGELSEEVAGKSENKNLERFGGNTDRPDIINHTDREVISFKCYTFINDIKAKGELGDSHVDVALKLNYDCFEKIFIMEEAMFYKYRVSLPALTKNASIGEIHHPPLNNPRGNTPSSSSFPRARKGGRKSSSRRPSAPPPAAGSGGGGGVSQTRTIGELLGEMGLKEQFIKSLNLKVEKLKEGG